MRLLCATLEPTLDEKIAYITRERNHHILCGREHEGAMLNTILASLERLKALDASPSICETEQKVSNSAYTAGALDDMPRCDGCGQRIDPDTCGCGAPINGYHDNHSPVPMGCDCYRERSPASRDERQGEWDEDATRLERELRALVNQLRMPEMNGKLTMGARAQLIAAETLLLDPPIRARRRDLLPPYAPAVTAAGDTHNLP